MVFPFVLLFWSHEDAREKKERRALNSGAAHLAQFSVAQENKPWSTSLQTASRKLAEFCSPAPGCLAYKMTLSLPQPFYLIAPGAIIVALYPAILEKNI